ASASWWRRPTPCAAPTAAPPRRPFGLRRCAGRKPLPPCWNCAAPPTCSARPVSWLAVFINTPVPPGERHAIATTDQTAPNQALEARTRLESLVQRAQQDDEGAGPAPAATPPNQHPEALTRLTEGAQRHDEGAGPAPPTPPPTQDPAARAHLESLVQRAQQGDECVLPELRQVLDAHPELWQRCGDLALQAQTAWLQLISGKDLLLREAVQRKLDQMKEELVGL